MLQRFDTFINKSRASEQTFFVQVEINTLNSPFGQSATRVEDFVIGASPGMSTVPLRLEPSEPSETFSYQINDDNIPENQEVFQLSITPAIDSPTFTCTQATGCFQQLEIVIVDDDGEFGNFLDLHFLIQLIEHEFCWLHHYGVPGGDINMPVSGVFYDLTSASIILDFCVVHVIVV